MKIRVLSSLMAAALLFSGSAFAGDYMWSAYKDRDYVSRKGATTIVMYQPGNFLVSPTGKKITGVQVQLRDSTQADVSMMVCYNNTFDCVPMSYTGRVYEDFNGRLADKPFYVKYTGTGLGPYPRSILATMVVYYND
ncbi:hypothetical protein [Achromobacter xylosoxidans]|uniref:hypothetical protein n=1 Tax=Alcaligenes xylosoxydans xylosoxydans TaxID=85698 RepID=UPI001EEDB7D6|nr:hypothetical protein [Achromobacter xylosoxidans]